MDFRFTQEQDEAAELAASILKDRTTNDRLKAVEAPATASTASCGPSSARPGCSGSALPEEYDGAGLGLIELARVLVEVGRTVAPVPLAAHGPASRLIAELGSDAQKQQWLPGAATGRQRADRRRRRGARLLPRPADDRGRAGRHVVRASPAARRSSRPARTPTCSWCPAETPSGVGRLPRRARRRRASPWSRRRSPTATAVARLDLDGAVLGADRLVGAADGAADQRLRQLLVLAGSAEQLGITEGALKLTSSYAKTREQFGRPIGTFQAVSQRLADGYIDVLGQRLTLWQAAWRLEEGLPADSEVAIAKLWAADAGHRLAHTTVHVHGGVGIDLDGEAHRYFTSAKRFEFLHGGATEQALNDRSDPGGRAGVTDVCCHAHGARAAARAGGRRRRPGCCSRTTSWTWAEVVHESSVRAAVLAALLPDGEPPHVGVLLENVPEFAFLLGGAALGGQVRRRA